jgi:hypothetical protein
MVENYFANILVTVGAKLRSWAKGSIGQDSFSRSMGGKT